MNSTQTSTAVPNQQEVQAPSLMGNLSGLVVLGLAFYFLLIRPQRKQEAKKKEMISQLKKGNRIITASGIIGKIHKVVNEDELSVEIADGVNLRILRNAVVRLIDNDSNLGKDLEDSTSSKSVAKKKAKAK